MPRDDGESRLSRARYRGRTFTKLSRWFKGDDGQMHPTKCVNTIRDHELDAFIQALVRIRNHLRGHDRTRETRRPSAAQRSLPMSAPPADADPDPEGLF